MNEATTTTTSLTEYALDQAPEFVLITDADLTRRGGPRIVYVNQAMARATGYTRAELIGKSPKIFQGEDTDAAVASRILKRLAAGEHVEETILNYTKDGTPYWAELNISPVRDDNGETIAYLSIQKDLTKLRKIKEQHERDLRLISTGEKIARVGTWGYDIDEDKVLWSDGAYDIWEWDKSEAPPSVTDCVNFVDEPDRQMMTAMMEACIKTQTPYQAEVRARSSKGTPMRLRVLGEAMLGENGRTTAVVGAVRDITEERRIEAELDESISQSRETEQYFMIARSVAKIGVFDYWIDHDRLHWSDELFEMTGLSPEGFPAKADVFLSRINPEDHPGYEKLMQHAIQTKEGYSVTVRFNRPDGKVMHMAIIAEVRESNYGPRIVGIARDVTVEAEALQRLSREQERFRIIADSVSDVLWDQDFEAETFWITPNWPAKLGVDFDGVGDDPMQWLPYVVVEDRERVVTSVEQALESDADRWECEFRLQDHEGTIVEIEVKASILRHSDGKAYRILGNCRNVTVEKRQREGFTRSRALEAVGQMTGGIAHDFNNLLMIIQGNAELLEMANLEGEDAESVALIMQAAEAAANLTSRLLSFSGQGYLSTSSVDLRDLIENVTLLLRSALTESIELKTTVAPDLEPIEVDGRALEQAIINLAVNARDAIGNDGGKVEISCENVTITNKMVAAKSDLVPGRYVCISVSDNGSGMSPRVISKAFEPFFTTKDVGKGTGLGLSTVYGFARQSGGTAHIYSELGQGTVVNLYLPIGKVSRVEKRPSAVANANLSSVDIRILVVEDQAEVRAHVERLLRNAGFKVVAAPDGKAALALLNVDPDFDLLFTDIIMPGGINGVQLAEAVRRMLPDIKVLFTSGFPASAFDELGIAEQDQFELLKKPYKSEELIAAIGRILRGPEQSGT
jgi:PAS domain S-box-containing protein